jgi:hypothetical protein
MGVVCRFAISRFDARVWSIDEQQRIAARL